MLMSHHSEGLCSTSLRTTSSPGTGNQTARSSEAQILAGVVRKKFGLELVSSIEADQRIYCVIAAMQA